MRKLWLIFYFIPVLFADARSLKPFANISEPMPGSLKLRTAVIWLQDSPDFRSVRLAIWKEGHQEKVLQKNYKGTLGREFNMVQMEISSLYINSRYQYRFLFNQVKLPVVGIFKVMDLWQCRRTVPSVSRRGWEDILQPEYFRKTINAIA